MCNTEGWVPIETIMTFKRMRDLGIPDIDFAAYALRQAIEAEGETPLIVVSEDGANVRRRRPLEKNSTAWDRSVYMVRAFAREGGSAKESRKVLARAVRSTTRRPRSSSTLSNSAR